jgi:hypothetical protein
MIKLFWRNQDEDQVKAIKESDSDAVIAIAYIAGWDADVFVVADSLDSYNDWVMETFKSSSDGWSSTDATGWLK